MEWQTRFSALPLSTQDTLPELSISLLDNLGVITMVGDDKNHTYKARSPAMLSLLRKTNQHLGHIVMPKAKCGVFSAYSITKMAMD